MSQGTFNDKKALSGFTLIEVLLVIGITLVLAAAAASPIYGNLQGQVQISETSAQIVQTLRIARERGIAGMNDERHGVYFDINVGEDDSFVLYQGDSYLLRDTVFDRVAELATTLSLSSTAGVDINFSKGTGVPSATGTVSITHEIIGSSTISINAFGVIGEE